MACCNTNSQCLIVTTINPIWHSHPVHPGTKGFTSCSLKSRESIIFAHNFILKQNTNQASHCFDFLFEFCFPCKRIRYIKPIAINTHTDCLNNHKCSVRYIFKATKQGALKVTLHHFLLIWLVGYSYFSLLQLAFSNQEFACGKCLSTLMLPVERSLYHLSNKSPINT